MKHIMRPIPFLFLSMAVLSGCAARSAEDRVNREPLRPAVAGYDPGYMVVANVPAPKYRMSGNTVYVGTSQRAVYILPGNAVEDGSAAQALANTDARLDAYLAAIEVQIDLVREQQANAASPKQEKAPSRNPERFLREAPNEAAIIDDVVKSAQP